MTPLSIHEKIANRGFEPRQSDANVIIEDVQEKVIRSCRLYAVGRILVLTWSYLSFFFIVGFNLGERVTVGRDGVVMGLLFLLLGLGLGFHSWLRHDFERIGKEL